MPMTLIQRQTLSGNQASVTFSNIPQNYQTLKLVCSSRASGTFTSASISIALNTSASNQSLRYLSGNGASTSSGTDTSIYGQINAASNTANTFHNGEFLIPNYSGAINKAISIDNILEDNTTTALQFLASALWSSTSSVSSITLTTNGGSFVANSTFSLYGIS